MYPLRNNPFKCPMFIHRLQSMPFEVGFGWLVPVFHHLELPYIFNSTSQSASQRTNTSIDQSRPYVHLAH